jgi:hypothetical protein
VAGFGQPPHKDRTVILDGSPSLNMPKEACMRKLMIALALTVTGLSLSACWDRGHHPHSDGDRGHHDHDHYRG